MEEVSFRIATLEDCQAILDIYADYIKNTAITFEYEVPSTEAFRQRMENILAKYPYVVAQCGSKVVGYAYAGVFKDRAAYDWACEVSIYLHPDVQKQGIGKRLYAYLEGYLKKMGLCNFYACISYPEVDDEYVTQNSAKFHVHVGFRMVGIFKQTGYKFGRWYDMVWMEKMIGEHKKDQAGVTWFSQLPH